MMHERWTSMKCQPSENERKGIVNHSSCVNLNYVFRKKEEDGMSQVRLLTTQGPVWRRSKGLDEKPFIFVSCLYTFFIGSFGTEEGGLDCLFGRRWARIRQQCSWKTSSSPASEPKKDGQRNNAKLELICGRAPLLSHVPHLRVRKTAPSQLTLSFGIGDGGLQPSRLQQSSDPTGA
uniref:Uncharacterized protein n=1 Tax=Panagrellus redivivus TaxID=6233 RepID=A0A7E4UVP4_PANRE